jgi:hypothetical protein
MQLAHMSALATDVCNSKLVARRIHVTRQSLNLRDNVISHVQCEAATEENTDRIRLSSCFAGSVDASLGWLRFRANSPGRDPSRLTDSGCAAGGEVASAPAADEHHEADARARTRA